MFVNSIYGCARLMDKITIASKLVDGLFGGRHLLVVAVEDGDREHDAGARAGHVEQVAQHSHEADHHSAQHRSGGDHLVELLDHRLLLVVAQGQLLGADVLGVVARRGLADDDPEPAQGVAYLENMAQMEQTKMVQRSVRCGQATASRRSQGAEMYQSSPPVILSCCQVPMSLMRADLQKRSCRICETLQNLEMTMDCRMTLMVEVKKSLMLTVCTQPGYFWLMNCTFVDRYCRYTSTRNTKNAPNSCDRLKPCSRVNACTTASHTECLVNRKCTSAMKAPSNSTPNSEVIVTGLKANQKMVQEVLATMNSEMPDPSPQPLLSRSSSRITITPAPISCATISAIVAMLISEGCPQAPYQMAPATSPKQKMSANTLSSALASRSSAFELIFMSPMATRIWPIQLAEMIGEMPNSMSEPLLEAMIMRAQQRGSESCERSMPQMGIWLQMRQTRRATAVNMVRCWTLSGAGGLGTCGKMRPQGLSMLSILNMRQEINLATPRNRFHRQLASIPQLIQKMASPIALAYDSGQIGTLNSEKVMVAVPLLYMFMTHYLFQVLRLIKGAKEAKERLNDLGKRLFLFGVACLFSVNFLQSSVIGAVSAWAILICMIIAHCFVFLRETGQKYHNICLLIYYSILMVWFGCSFFYFIYDALN